MVPMLGLQPNAKNWSKETFNANPVKLPERNLASQLQQALLVFIIQNMHVFLFLQKNPKTKRADP